MQDKTRRRQQQQRATAAGQCPTKQEQTQVNPSKHLLSDAAEGLAGDVEEAIQARLDRKALLRPVSTGKETWAQLKGSRAVTLLGPCCTTMNSTTSFRACNTTLYQSTLHRGVPVEECVLG